MNRSNFYALAVAAAMMAMPASGAVIFEAGSVTAAQGSTTGTIEIDVQNTGTTSVTIGGFAFEISVVSDIDFTGAGYNTSAPYIFFGDSFDQTLSQPLNTSTGSSLSANDSSNSGAGDTLVAGQTAGLALVTFDVSPTVPLGPITVSFNTDPSDSNLADTNGNPIPIDSFANGTITVTSATTGAVPEPSSAAMLLFCPIGLLAFRRWLKAGSSSRGC